MMGSAATLIAERDETTRVLLLLKAQAVEVSMLLSEAGCNAMPIPQAVRQVIAQRDEAIKTAQQWCDQFSAEAVKANGLRVALDEARKARDWQPISTAPKVENFGVPPIDALLYGPALGVRTGRLAAYQDGTVFAGVSNINGNVAFTMATHWQPLPPFPVPLDPPVQGDHE
jgi:hypothetical protein